MAFQRSQKSKTRVREEKGERKLLEEALVSIACSLQMGDKQVVSSRGHLRTYTVSPQAMTHSRMNKTKEGARRLEREVSGAQALCRKQGTSTVSRVWSLGFSPLEL